MVMVLYKEFFFVRHGQTDHNAGRIQGEHCDISLNVVGLTQAEAIEPIIATLSLHIIFCSPLLRARETKDILNRRISVRCLEMPEFAECSCGMWEEMQKGVVKEKLAKQFIARVGNGLQQVLAEKGPALIIAHGGVYSAICIWLNMKNERVIDNCVPMQFFLDQKGCWAATKLNCISDETG
jgi:uncharacterized phosphatase